MRGRWKFSSGCMGADIVGVGISPLKNNEMQGLPRMAVMPANKAKIEMTWDTVGLKGTGSHDLVVEDVLVEKEMDLCTWRTFKTQRAIFKYPSLSLATQVLTVVGIELQLPH